MERITKGVLAKCTMTLRRHTDGEDDYGKWFSDLYACDQHPRISMLKKEWKRNLWTTRSKPWPVTHWYVDGNKMPSLDAAIAALNVAPVLLPNEAGLLAKLSDEYADSSADLTALLILRDKGLAEVERGKWRRRPGAVFRPMGQDTVFSVKQIQ